MSQYSSKEGDVERRVNSGDVVELPQQGEMYNWKKFKPSPCCSCFSMVLQLVLMGFFGAFLFGINMSLLNTSLPMINSEYLNCGRDDVDVRNQYGNFSVEQCLDSPECTDLCGKFEDAKDPNIMSGVRCPGGYNDLDCSKLKWLNAVISCALLFGAMIGCLLAGRFLSSGRRFCLLICYCIFVFGIINCVVSNSFSALLWGRLVVGFAVGVVSVVAPAYMTEMVPAELRGRYGACFQLGIVIGILCGNLIGLPLDDPLGQNDYWSPPTFQRFWWRFMLGIGLIPTLAGVYFVALVYTFETPYYYAEQRRFKDVQEVLRLIHGREDVHEEVEQLQHAMAEADAARKNGLTFSSAFKDPELRWVIVYGCLLAAFQQFGGINVFMTSSNDLFKKAGLRATMQTVMSIIMTVINAVMTFPTLYLVEKMGRRTLLLCGATVQLIAVVPAAVLYWTEKNQDYPTDKTKWCAIIGVFISVAGFAIAYGPILWLYLHEIYPAEIKAVGSSAATAFNWGGGVIMVFIVIPLTNQISYTLFAGLQFIAVVIIFLWMKETKGLPHGVSPFITQKA